jgi:hypothetical protein
VNPELIAPELIGGLLLGYVAGVMSFAVGLLLWLVWYDHDTRRFPPLDRRRR